jgi:hypothetical protein
MQESVAASQVAPAPHWPTHAGVARAVLQAAQPGYVAVQVIAATGTQAPISQAVPAPQAGVQASGTHDPLALQTLPLPQKSAHFFSELHAPSPAASMAAKSSVILLFKCGLPFPAGEATRRIRGAGPERAH